LVLIRALQQQSQLNNTIGVIQDFAESSQRYRVIPSQGRATYLIQQDNLTQQGIVKPSDRPFRTQRCWSHLCFWPSIKDGDGTTITPVQAFHNGIEHIRDRPKCPFLRETFHWKNPDQLSGMEQYGKAKPTFIMYFDAGDTTSPYNQAAQYYIVDLLPADEKSARWIACDMATRFVAWPFSTTAP
jgi:hypothetical protein